MVASVLPLSECVKQLSRCVGEFVSGGPGPVSQVEHRTHLNELVHRPWCATHPARTRQVAAHRMIDHLPFDPRTIRSRGCRRLQTTPVIVISGVDGLDAVIRCIQLGADDYLDKPVDPVLLRARIEASLTNRRLHQQQDECLDVRRPSHSGDSRRREERLRPPRPRRGSSSRRSPGTARPNRSGRDRPGGRAPP